MRRLGPVPSEAAERVVEHVYHWMVRRLPGTVAAYLAMDEEVPVEGLIDRLPGWRWVLPRVEEDGSLTLRDRDVPREMHRWGMEQPTDQGPVIPVQEVDVILVPGLAFDRDGNRLGRGYYDRFLAERRGDTVAVGVTVAERIVPEVPVDNLDEPVDVIVTEEGVVVDRTADR
jgi:5-formyltetrahydrofolate cyclo-ligase